MCPNHLEQRRVASASFGYCGLCLSEREELLDAVLSRHVQYRCEQGLVGRVADSGTTVCGECANHCRLSDGEQGFCGLRSAVGQRIVERYPGKAIVYSYFDPLPTNCTAGEVCAVSKRESTRQRPGGRNLAVFYGSCNSDCLYCQNESHFSMVRAGRPLVAPSELASAVGESTACVCFFGGDPSCNAQHSIETSMLVRERWNIPICYETNGRISSKYLDRISDIVIQSRGTLKIDLKAYSPRLYQALTGTSNQPVLRNFRYLASRGKYRDHEFLVASILLVPGYVGVIEVQRLCSFIANCDCTIPTVLLGFYPHRHMLDLPSTSRHHAYECKRVAEDAGLTNVRIGNLHLLSDDRYDIS
ncbi:MAG: radical SAM protein [Candidatus Thorarchaeota archaeon]